MAHLSRSLQIPPAAPAPAIRRRSEETPPNGREEALRQMMLLHEAQKSVVPWVPDALVDRCYQCQAFFSLVLRRHHCRRCGNVFCDSCSSARMPLVSAGFFTPVRVCDSCCEAAKKTHRRMYNERKRLSQSAHVLDVAHHEHHLFQPLSPMDESESSYAASPAAALMTTIIDVIPGEVVSFRSPNVRLRIPNGCEYAGTVFITNYRLVFSQASHECISTSEACQRSHRRYPAALPADQFTAAPRYHAIPLRTIERVKRQEIAETDTGILHVVCKDVRRIQLVFLGLVKQQTFGNFDRCDRDMRLRAPFFAKCFVEHFPHALLDGWAIYDPVAEFNRLGVGATTKWRITSINQAYDFCPSYSASIAVPASISDDVLRVAGAFRSKARIPALTWRDKKTGATICRSSQPLVGLGQKQCAEDVMLIQAIAATNPSSSTMVIVDARPWRNAMAQKTVGMAGYELTAHYETKVTESIESSAAAAAMEAEETTKTMMLGLTTCRLVFMGIENIHVMRRSFQKLSELCLVADPARDQPGKWHDQLAQTKWMDHLSRILHAAIEIVRLIKTDKASVLVHCSDGWDRTSQLTGLAELMLDPYYRTIRGFCLLVEKDWCSFGYKFCERTGHAGDASSQEISVVFVQWIDCVWQLWRQFPCSFEFNSRFLILILDHLYSCRFGTFLYDSESHRVVEEGQQPTESLWTYLSSLEPSFISNPFYEPRKYSRQNWHARIVERRQAVEVQMMPWQHHHAVAAAHTPTMESHVGLEEKEDGVVWVHTDCHKGPPTTTTTMHHPSTTEDSNSVNQTIPAVSKKARKKIHSIVQDLDTGLMFPHVIETLASPLPSPSFVSTSSMVAAGMEYDSLEFGSLPRRPNDLDSDDGSSSESEGSQASSQDVRSFGPDADVLVPSVSVKCLRLWSEYYLRWDASATTDRNGDLEREAKLRDVLGELEYYKRKRADKDAMAQREEDRKAMDLFEEEMTQVLAEIEESHPLSSSWKQLPSNYQQYHTEGAIPKTRESPRRCTTPMRRRSPERSHLSRETLERHNNAMQVEELVEQHRVAMNRMAMQFEDLLSRMCH
ncbi:hypothetical protein LEN26_020682 [Aphanomyces euteiches]|nr:hypothetical protein LEN26_020682 [Aphanomyces euteiches]KAH9105955.1 hypothetical protein AeMF1_018334 [Aphanomyces euteiches]KAH9182732.1 hypothetical protein AeNC1_015294 [Aphanomyces euteiches]